MPENGHRLRCVDTCLSHGADARSYYMLDAQYFLQPVPHREYTVSNIRSVSSASEHTSHRTQYPSTPIINMIKQLWC
jgi:hypothetical protein